MDVSFAKAANAYASRMQSGAQDDAESTSGASGAGSAFGQLLSNTLGDLAQTQKTVEAASTNAISTGKEDLTNIITAISNAELTLNTVVAVRDRVISAYQDILRMPI